MEVCACPLEVTGTGGTPITNALFDDLGRECASIRAIGIDTSIFTASSAGAGVAGVLGPQPIVKSVSERKTIERIGNSNFVWDNV